MISIIIPSYKDPYLNNTVESLLLNAKGEIEIICVLDGWWTAPIDDKRVRVLHVGQNKGMRNAINMGVAMANGRYIMKLDSHCTVAEGFDTELIKAHQENWVQVPTRKRLDAEKWELVNDGRSDINYLYLDENLKGVLWNDRNADKELKNKKIDDIVAFQGSCYFMSKDFYKRLEILDDVNFGAMGHESQEITFKCWLKGGHVIRNKNTWYAHWHRTESPSGGNYNRSKSRTCLSGWYKRRKEKIDKYIKLYGKTT